MRIVLAVIVASLVLVLVSAVWLFVDIRLAFGPDPDAPPLNLNWASLSTASAGQLAGAEDVVLLLYDGTDRNWPYHVVEDQTFLRSKGARYGRYQRLIDSMIGYGTACYSEKGKWMRLFDGSGRKLVSAAYCNPRRLDLSALKAHTIPAIYNEVELTRVEAIAKLEEIATDPEIALLDHPQSFKPFDFTVEIQLPYFWGTQDNLGLYPDADKEALEAWLLAQSGLNSGDLSVSLDMEFHHRQLKSKNSMPNREGEWFSALWQKDGTRDSITGLTLSRTLMYISCNAPDCEALQFLETADLPADLAAHRSQDVLKAMIEAATPYDGPPSMRLADRPAFEDLMNSTIHVASPVSQTYTVSWYKKR